MLKRPMLLSALPSSWNPNQEVRYRRWEELEGEVLEELLMGIPQLIDGRCNCRKLMNILGAGAGSAFSNVQQSAPYIENDEHVLADI